MLINMQLTKLRIKKGSYTQDQEQILLTYLETLDQNDYRVHVLEDTIEITPRHKISDLWLVLYRLVERFDIELI